MADTQLILIVKPKDMNRYRLATLISRVSYNKRFDLRGIVTYAMAEFAYHELPIHRHHPKAGPPPEPLPKIPSIVTIESSKIIGDIEYFHLSHKKDNGQHRKGFSVVAFWIPYRNPWLEDDQTEVSRSGQYIDGFVWRRYA